MERELIWEKCAQESNDRSLEMGSWVGFPGTGEITEAARPVTAAVTKAQTRCQALWAQEKIQMRIWHWTHKALTSTVLHQECSWPLSKPSSTRIPPANSLWLPSKPSALWSHRTPFVFVESTRGWKPVSHFASHCAAYGVCSNQTQLAEAALIPAAEWNPGWNQATSCSCFRVSLQAVVKARSAQVHKCFVEQGYALITSDCFEREKMCSAERYRVFFSFFWEKKYALCVRAQ